MPFTGRPVPEQAVTEMITAARAEGTPPDAHHPYGIPLTPLGPPDAAGRMPTRAFTGPLPGLRAGQALERALPVATGHGVRTSTLRQAMEWPDLRAATTGSRHRCRPRPLTRFGYGPHEVRPRRGAQRHGRVRVRGGVHRERRGVRVPCSLRAPRYMPESNWVPGCPCCPWPRPGAAGLTGPCGVGTAGPEAGTLGPSSAVCAGADSGNRLPSR